MNDSNPELEQPSNDVVMEDTMIHDIQEMGSAFVIYFEI